VIIRPKTFFNSIDNYVYGETFKTIKVIILKYFMSP